MALIAGIRIPSKKRLVIALTYIYGVGSTTAVEICNKVGISVDKRVNDLTDLELTKLREIINSDYTVEGDLRRVVNASVKALIDIKCYRGMRRVRKLPVRGQNTRNNARTSKGGKAKAIAGKKKAVK